MYYDKLFDLGIKLTRRYGSEKTRCPQCSDGRKNKHDKPLSVNITTGEYNCHHCSWKGNVRGFIAKRDHREYSKPPADVLKNIELKESIIGWFNERGISLATLDKFMIYAKREWMPQTQKEENCICFPYFRDGEMVNVKYRDSFKNFKLHKDAELVFYNLQSIQDKKHCIIVEGEIDCMAVYEAGLGVDKIISDDG
jgi:twinkle protein